MHGVMEKEENMEKWQEPKEWNYLKKNEKKMGWKIAEIRSFSL